MGATTAPVGRRHPPADAARHDRRRPGEATGAAAAAAAAAAAQAAIGWLRTGDDHACGPTLDDVPQDGCFGPLRRRSTPTPAPEPVAHVAIAYDGSTNSRAAIEAFSRLAFAGRTTVTVVGVQEPAAAGAELTSGVTDVAERLRTMGIAATTRILHGHPPEMIASFVHRAHPDLLVLGASERPRRGAGSIAESIAREGECHVLVARAA